MTIKRRTPRPETALKAPARPKGPRLFSTAHMREKFVLEYLKDQNGTQAAIRAGYSPRSAHAQASRLLKDDKVASTLSKHQARVLKPLVDQYEITQGRIARELALLSFSNLQDLGRVDHDGEFIVDLTGATRDQFAAIQAIETTRTVRTIGDSESTTTRTKLKVSDKRQALMDLARLQGYTKDEGAIGGNVTFNVIWNPGLPGPTPYEDEEAA